MTIGGVEVSRVSLHNQYEIDRKDIRIADHVIVERAGDVIPHVVRVLKKKRNGTQKKYSLPDTCPVCGGGVARPGGEAVARCTNPSCPARLEKSIIHFGSRGALDIDGLGEKLVRQLVEKDLVQSLEDLFELGEEQLAGLDRMGKKSARNLVEAIRNARDGATLPRLIYGLGIPHVGKSVARDLAAAFGSLDRLAASKRRDLLGIDSIGDTMADAIMDWFANSKNKTLIKELKKRGLDPKMKEPGGKLKGQTFVFTGALDSMSRTKAQEAVERRGGRATSSVSGNTNYLVKGSDPGETKMRDAEENVVRVIDEKTFLKIADIAKEA